MLILLQVHPGFSGDGHSNKHTADLSIGEGISRLCA